MPARVPACPCSSDVIRIITFQDRCLSQCQQPKSRKHHAPNGRALTNEKGAFVRRIHHTESAQGKVSGGPREPRHGGTESSIGWLAGGTRLSFLADLGPARLNLHGIPAPFQQQPHHDAGLVVCSLGFLGFSAQPNPSIRESHHPWGLLARL